MRKEKVLSGEASRILRVSQVTVQNLAKNGELDFEMIGGIRIFKRSDVEALAKKRGEK